eukprot:TRINITY_DN4451_c0_g1_i1.p1 TRINITY_DN4451_c0_g1~~TRINITY_DN4451_c0_g1_i1.p1  ORF type:complete len:1343 (-),score=281.39 TRINITY_DN4451_c0_g1_i1:181-4209(-)
MADGDQPSKIPVEGMDAKKKKAVLEFKQKLEATMQNSSGGRSKRRAAALAGERVKEQMDMERGVLRAGKNNPSQSSRPPHESKSIGSERSSQAKPRKRTSSSQARQDTDQELSKHPATSPVQGPTGAETAPSNPEHGDFPGNQEVKDQAGAETARSNLEHGHSTGIQEVKDHAGAGNVPSNLEHGHSTGIQEVKDQTDAETAPSNHEYGHSPGMQGAQREQMPQPRIQQGSGIDLSGLSALASSAGRLPKRLSGCAYDAAGGNWVPKVSQVPKARRDNLLKGFSHQVEKAKSSAAACKRCGDKITKATTRVGYPVKDHRGEYGAIVNWFHVFCARSDETLMAYAKMGDARLRKNLLGYEALPKEDRIKLREDLLSTERPEELTVEAPAVQEVRSLPQHPPPKDLKVPMLAFQAEGLGWMLAREADSTTRGGILADEMGMGKTLQTISLLLAGDVKGPTLVVVPPAAMLQWRNEILRFTQPGSLEVRLYYGSDRKSGLEDLFNESVLFRRVVVLTTYQTLENEYRREANRTKVQCQWCGRLFLKDKLAFHQKYFCGPDAERTEKQQKTQLKSEAVKKMKIGGTETEIVLNPLNAIRSAATQALRRRAVGKRPEQASVGSSDDKVTGATEASTPPGKRKRLSKKSSIAKDAGDASLQRADSLGGTDEASGGGSKANSSTPEAECSASRISLDSTPGPLSAPKKRWIAGSLRVKTSEEEAAPKANGLGWGAALQSRRSMSVIELSQSDDSDLELLQEVGGACDGGLAVGTGSSSSTPLPKDGAKAGISVPTLPESDDEEGDGGKIDLSRSPLFSLVWGRIVLDEAHRIKSRTNSTAQAAFALRASGSRWCLSGTPLQNRVGEFWSIIRFVRFYPYAHYFCKKKGCNCCSLHYRFDPDTSLCKKCGHTKLQHASHFATTVSNPIKKFGFIGAGKVAMEKLRSEVLDKILLRRTKLERAADVKLPALEVRIRKDPLSPQEKDFYTSMYSQGRTEFDTYVESGTLLHNYAHVFDLIMRLRQAVDHPYLIVHGSLKAADPHLGLMPSKSRGNSNVCGLCQDDIEERSQQAKASCGHAFHRDCLKEYMEQAPQLPSGGVGCPTCFSPMTWAEGDAGDDEDGQEDIVEDVSEAEDQQAEGLGDTSEKSPKPGKRARGSIGGKFANSIMQKIKTSEFQSSTKVEALVQEIKRMGAADSLSKALVFSQFSRFLELIEWRLKREGISAATVLGSMSIVSRNNIVVSFQTEPTLKVLLISLKAGGEGLNLQAADHIFLMDPWWNPAAEMQAIQRAHRIGQTRPVKALRFVAEDTIEEKIIELQEKKQSVFDCTVGNSNQALQRLSAEDIQFLFSN